MKIRNLLLLAFVVGSLTMNAQSKLTPYSRNIIEKGKNQTERIGPYALKGQNIDDSQNGSTVSAFVELKDGSSTDAIEALGAQVGTKAGNIITIVAPLSSFEAMAELPEVKKIDFSRRVYLKNDMARAATFVSNVHAGLDLSQPFKGAGVIYGTVDTGIDFNHINFKDDDGNLRISRVYLTGVKTGTAPQGYIFDGNGNITGSGTLPGSEYTTPAAIGALTTDTKSESHGSHTLGIGAGGYKLNGYYGMAPEAEIIACGSSNLTDAEIINGVGYVFANAEKEGKSAVVNLSLGGNQGPHDGTSLMEKCFDNLAGKGNIIVMSAGNEGSDPLYVTKDITATTDTLKTFIKDYSEGAAEVYGTSDTWGSNAAAITLSVVIYDIKQKKEVYRSTPFTAAATGSSMTIKSTSDSNFKKYYTGTINISGGLDDNGRFNVTADYDISSSASSPTYRFGLILSSEVGNTIHSWTDDYYSYYTNESIDGYVDGSSNFSINSMACGKNTISVGAYCSRTSYKNISGKTVSISGAKLNQLAYFSSYGPDFNGVERPDIVGPGFPIVSSVNSFDTNTVASGYSSLASEVTANSRKHQWGQMSGTSMSSPAVAGIIATWLQADPTLDSDGIKAIFAKTAIRDSYVTSGSSHAWGSGKIDAYAGIVEVLKGASVDGAITNKNVVMLYPNPSNGVFDIYIQNEPNTVSLKIYNANGAMVYSEDLDASQGKVTVDVSGILSSGMYFVQVVGSNCNNSSQLIIK